MAGKPKLPKRPKATAGVGSLEQHLKAIKAVLPPSVAVKDIYITLGSPWVPTDIIDDFIGLNFLFLLKKSKLIKK